MRAGAVKWQTEPAPKPRNRNRSAAAAVAAALQRQTCKTVLKGVIISLCVCVAWRGVFMSVHSKLEMQLIEDIFDINIRYALQNKIKS